MQTIRIKYVGKKAVAFDNVASSGKSWHGAGDVQEVTVPQAKELVKFTDQWALDNADDAQLFDVVQTVTVADGDGGSTKVNLDELDANRLESMTKTELMAYAKTLGKELKPQTAKADMVDQIEEWQKEAGL